MVFRLHLKIVQLYYSKYGGGEDKSVEENALMRKFSVQCDVTKRFSLLSFVEQVEMNSHRTMQMRQLSL